MHESPKEASRVPASPGELLARQQLRPPRPPSPEEPRSETLERLEALLRELRPCAHEQQQLALLLLRQLETFHDHVVADLQEDPRASHRRIARWAVDADRLYRARMILEAIDLE